MSDPAEIVNAPNSVGAQAKTVLVIGEALVDQFESGPPPGGAPFNVARSLAVLIAQRWMNFSARSS